MCSTRLQSLTLIATGIRCLFSALPSSCCTFGRFLSSKPSSSFLPLQSCHRGLVTPLRPGISQASSKSSFSISSTSDWKAGSSTWSAFAHPLYTWATHPEPTGSLLSICKKLLQPSPKALRRHCLVWAQEWGRTLTWSLEKRLQNSWEKMSRLVLAHWPSLMKVGPDVSVTHSKASSQRPAQRDDTRAKGERRRRGPNLKSSTNARKVRRKKNITLCTWTLARDFLSDFGNGRIASWHLAAQHDAFTAPKHNNVTLGIWVKICPLLTKHVLEFWMSLVLVKEPAFWKVYLRLKRTALAPKVSMVITSVGC